MRNKRTIRKKDYKKVDKKISLKEKLKESKEILRLNNSYLINKKREIMIGGKNIKEEYIEILKQLAFYNKKFESGGIFKAKYYIDGINKLEKMDKELNRVDDLPDVSKAVKNKFEEFLETGEVKNLEELKKKHNNIYDKEKIENDKNSKAKSELMQIHGIGDKLADKLLNMGISNIEELEKRKDEEIDSKGKKKLKLLNNVQQIGLRYYKETIQRIPRKEIEEYEILLKEYFKLSFLNLSIL